MFFLYNLALSLAALLAIPYYLLKMLITGKYRKSLGHKLGFIPEDRSRAAGTPRIWIHAVSVGEVTAALPVVEALRARFKEAALFFSTGTETGQEMARRLLPHDVTLIYYPLDIPWVIRRFLDRLRPEVFVATETELWPNFLKICARRNITTVMINGRLSPRSFRLYKATGFFWRRILNSFAAVGVISEEHGRRFAALGLPGQKIFVLGNAKYDGLAARTSPELRQETQGMLGFSPDEPVLVAGSTHEGEEEIILRVTGRLREFHRGLKLIIAPRHIERVEKVLALARAEGFSHAHRLSDLSLKGGGSKGEVVVVDSIGALFKLYSVAEVVFLGGSLVPKGGQNILEAAAWGKMVFFGPHMDDFLDEAAALKESGGGLEVRNEEELFEGIKEVLSRREFFRKRGRRAQEMVRANMGVAAKYVELIEQAITSPGDRRYQP